MEPSKEEIALIDEWLIKFYPVKGEFILADEYYKQLPKEESETWPNMEARSQINKITLLFTQRMLIETTTIDKRTRSHLTPLGILIAEAGGWNKYKATKAAEKRFEDNRNRLYVIAQIAGMVAGLYYLAELFKMVIHLYPTFGNNLIEFLRNIPSCK